MANLCFWFSCLIWTRTDWAVWSKACWTHHHTQRHTVLTCAQAGFASFFSPLSSWIFLCHSLITYSKSLKPVTLKHGDVCSHYSMKAQIYMRHHHLATGSEVDLQLTFEATTLSLLRRNGSRSWMQFEWCQYNNFLSHRSQCIFFSGLMSFGASTVTL